MHKQEILDHLETSREQFLDRYSPESPPAGMIESVPGASGKGALHEMFSRRKIFFGLKALCLSVHHIQGVLVEVPVNGSSQLVVCAPGTQRARAAVLL